MIPDKFYDVEGMEVSLETLCRKEPAWAANQIRGMYFQCDSLRDRVVELEAQKMPINILFDGPPGPVSGRYIEVETDEGRGIKVGEWIERPNGLWALRIERLRCNCGSR